ncbi:VIN3-like protein 2 isoform X2 [Telopea speciosissima]|uniref:VIN3-like protein 2 isoform X2 n=1 Tax=Telopea speciosissima TaxID=54955 RepID=UPI001CC668E0|nr:VIN3-like protein 2 isoform X2 [Telopea speciosissima]
MDSSFAGFVLDPSKCSKLSMEEKRELVYEISKSSHGAPEMLQSWSRREILQILCAEMGKERKYTGLTKFKLIEQLLKIVSEKKSGIPVDGAEPEPRPAPANSQSSSKRQRKTDHPSRLPIVTNDTITIDGDGDQGKSVFCPNSACKATIQRQDAFCKRCSCCICYNYDDNKDPSLWLVCSSEPPYEGDSCGLSCHLDCALKHEKAGIAKVGQHGRLDGSFYCVSCGKVNDLLRCWKKQLVMAKDTRRVDTLCYRVSLCQKLLSGTEKYQKLHEIVNMAAKKLEADVGTLTLVNSPVKKARGIVNRLPSGQEVQKLCTSAVELLDSMLSCAVSLPPSNPEIQESCVMSPPLIRFENVCPTSLTVVFSSEDASLQVHVVYMMWHRKADDLDYPVEPTYSTDMRNSKFFMFDLSPATEYLFKVVSLCGKGELSTSEARITTSSAESCISKSLVVEGSQSPATNSSTVSNPSSEADESNNIIVDRNEKDKLPGRFLNFVRKELVDSNKLSDASGKVICNSQKTNSGSGQEQTLADFGSALDEEHAVVEVVPISSLTIQMESHRDSSNSTVGNQVSDVIKSDNMHSPEGRLVEDLITDKGINTPIRKEMEIVLSEAVLPITPCKLEIGKDGPGRSGRPKACTEELDDGSGKGEEPQAGSSSKMQSEGRWDDGCGRDGSLDGEYEYCVKLIRWLECHGHIEKNFRVKFLTWYSLRATPQERRIVKVYVDTLSDDPACLAGQLIDTFTECISSKRSSSAMPTGFCMRLWH